MVARATRSPLHRSGIARTALASTALLAYLVASGCGSISVADNTPTSSTPALSSEVSDSLATGPSHDLAIMGVDFDPPLDVDRIANHEPITLVVGVSNQGNRRETNVRLTADLWSVDRSQHLLHSEQTMGSIAAGNVVPVRLVNTRTPPFLTVYHLSVDIVPVDGESNTQNNSRQLDILVNSSH